jgi:hypothetical protein
VSKGSKACSSCVVNFSPAPYQNESLGDLSCFLGVGSKSALAQTITFVNGRQSFEERGKTQNETLPAVASARDKTGKEVVRRFTFLSDLVDFNPRKFGLQLSLNDCLLREACLQRRRSL